MTRWLVIGPEYETCGGSMESGPPEYGCDVVEVEATSLRDALVLGVKMLRDQPYLQRYSDENPFAGVVVKSFVSDNEHELVDLEGT